MRKIAAIALAVIALLLTQGVSVVGAETGPTIAVSPTTGLHNNETVTITGSDWTSALAGAFVCKTSVYDAAPPSGDARWLYILGNCGGLQIANVASDGTFTLPYVVQQGGCGVAAGDCVIYAMGENGSNVFSTNAVPISFATPPPPTCFLRSTSSSAITIGVQAIAGLDAITVTTANNATVSVPSFTPGTTDLVVVSATKVDLSHSAQVALRVTDTHGTVTNCDPILATLVKQRHPLVLRHVPAAEHFVTVTNGAPGLRRVTVIVAHETLQVRVAPHESRTVDIGQMLPARRTYTLRLRGVGRGSADIMVWDGTSPSTMRQGATAGRIADRFAAR